MKNNLLIKALARDGRIRISTIDCTQYVGHLQKINHTSATASAAIGRASAFGMLYSSLMMKGSEELILKINGNGPAGTIIVEGSAKGNFRSYITNPQADLPTKENNKLDVSGVVGKNGFVELTKEVTNAPVFTGSSEIISGELAEDFAYFLATSDQVKSVVSLGVLVEKDLSIKLAGGYIIQLMPDATEEDIKFLENKLKDIPSYTGLSKEKKNEEYIFKYFFENDYQVIGKHNYWFECKCTREKAYKGINMLSKEEKEDILNTEGKLEVECHFCRKKYDFTNEN